MTKLELFDFAENRNIDIENFKMNNKSLSVDLGGNAYAIAMDEQQITDEAEAVSLLAHELGHCETGAFYNVHNHLDVRTKHEYRADKWAIKKLLPLDELETALKCGYVEVWQLAEYFGVTEDLVKKAMWIYFDKTF